MKAEVTWQASETGLAFDGVMDDGKTLHLDGNNESLSPMQAVLISCGACSSVDVVEIMRKARQPIDSCVCKLDAKRADDAPRIFTHIHAHYSVSGNNIKEKHLARAVQLSTEKYCSVMLMLGNAENTNGVKITSSYSID